MARPTEYNAGVNEKARAYLKDYKTLGDVVPSIEGLAVELDVARKTLYNWANENEEFLHTLEAIKSTQARLTMNGGLDESFNSTISKLLLANHGYSDKQELTLIPVDPEAKKASDAAISSYLNPKDDDSGNTPKQ